MARRLVLDAIVLEDSEVTTPSGLTVTPLQWAYDQLTLRETQMPPIGTPWPTELSVRAQAIYPGVAVENKRGGLGELFPYRVPADAWLGLTQVQFACKISTPESYCIVKDVKEVISIPSHHPLVAFETPFLLPGGADVSVFFINNSTWDQRMSVVLQAVLIEGVPNTWTYRQVLAELRKGT